MLSLSPAVRIFVHALPTDMRKSFDWDRHRKGSRFPQGSGGQEVAAGRWG